jgi:photosystem II stability/assembly factor-like uncharacterized protein
MTDDLMVWRDANKQIRHSRARGNGSQELPFEPVVSSETLMTAPPTVTTMELTGTALALPAMAGRRVIRIQNTSRGSGVAWIGGAGVDYASRNGIRLAAGEVLELAATDAAGLYASGEAWESISSLPDLSNLGNLTYIGGSDKDSVRLVNGVYNSGTVWVSVDGGKTWTPSAQLGTETDIYGAAAVNSRVLLIGTSPTGQVYRSVDGGATWALTERLGTETAVLCITRLTATANGTGGTTHLVAGTSPTGQVYRSTDGGQTWTLVQRLGSETGVRCITRISGTGASAVLVAGTSPTGQVYRSTDGGQTWTLVQRLGSETFVQTIAYISGTGASAVLVAGTFPNGQIYRSTDGGQTWTLAQNVVAGANVSVSCIAYISGSGDTAHLVAGGSNGIVYRSVNGGQTWVEQQAVAGATGISSLVTALGGANNDALVFANTLPGNRIWRTTDGAVVPIKIMEY